MSWKLSHGEDSWRMKLGFQGPNVPPPTRLNPDRHHHSLCRLPLLNEWKWGPSPFLRQETDPGDQCLGPEQGAQFSLWVSLPLRLGLPGCSCTEGIQNLGHKWARLGACQGDLPLSGRVSQCVFPRPAVPQDALGERVLQSHSVRSTAYSTLPEWHKRPGPLKLLINPAGEEAH